MSLHSDEPRSLAKSSTARKIHTGLAVDLHKQSSASESDFFTAKWALAALGRIGKRDSLPLTPIDER